MIPLAEDLGGGARWAYPAHGLTQNGVNTGLVRVIGPITYRSIQDF